MHRRKFITATAIGAALVTTKSFSLPVIPPKAFVVKNKKSRFNEQTNVGGSVDIKVSTKDTGSALSIFEYNSTTKGGPPLHLHLLQDEIFFIQQGDYLFQVGNEKHKLTAGDTIFLPRNVPHTFAQVSETGKLFYLFNPAGKIEDFFRTLSAIKGMPSPAIAAKIFEDHDMKIVGPPLVF
jgi:quercetin dioxygenase-like cupin family protein